MSDLKWLWLGIGFAGVLFGNPVLVIGGFLMFLLASDR